MLLSDVRKLLPIGSVVLVKEARKKLMITGIRQTDKSKTEYDYIAVLYPEGSMGEERYLFNHEDIVETVFTGFGDDERTQFLERLYKYFAEK